MQQEVTFYRQSFSSSLPSQVQARQFHKMMTIWQNIEQNDHQKPFQKLSQLLSPVYLLRKL